MADGDGGKVCESKDVHADLSKQMAPNETDGPATAAGSAQWFGIRTLSLPGILPGLPIFPNYLGI